MGNGNPTEYILVHILLCIPSWLMWLIIHGGDPPPPDVDRNRLINNIYYVTLAAVALTTAATYQEEVLSARYGPLALVSTMPIVVGLYYNNVAAPAVRKVKA